MELKLPKIDIGFLKQNKKPLHIAINASQLKSWKKDQDEEEVVAKNIEQIKTFMNYQIKTELPVLTLNISADSELETKQLKYFFQSLINDEQVQKNKIRIFIIGKWYDLDTEISDTFKRVMDETKDYDNLFLNFCVKYDGQEEVLGVIKLLATKAKLGKLELDDLNKQMVKENLYSSYFTPPEIIIEPSKTYSGLLLWDSKDAKIFQTRKHWLDLKTDDVDAAIVWANREIE